MLLYLSDYFAVIGKEHIAYHPEHEDLESYNNEEHSEDGERQVLNAAKPFAQNKDPGEKSAYHDYYPYQAEVEERVAHTRKPIDS